MRTAFAALLIAALAGCGGDRAPEDSVREAPADMVFINWQGDGTLVCNGQAFSGGLTAGEACIAALGPTDGDTRINIVVDGDVISGEVMALLDQIEGSDPDNVTLNLAD